jgi:Ca-activated chloride channel homolog
MAHTIDLIRRSDWTPNPISFICALALALSCSWSAAFAAPPSPDAIQLVSYDSEGAERPFTIESTDVQVDISAAYASVVVTQTFRNPFEVPLEGIYRFPLPHDAAVDRVGLIVGGRLIEAEIQRREEARETYEVAKAEGRRAALVEEKRPNVFEQAVANVMPGEVVHVTLHYVAPVAYEDAQYTFAFPSVVGPRYVSGATAASSGGAAAGIGLNPSYVADAETDHRLSVQMHLNPGLPVFQVDSPSHALESHPGKGDSVWVQLADTEARSDKTVEIRYRLATNEPLASLVAHRTSGEDGTFVLTVEPPIRARQEDVHPKELIFVVDTSGSMMGEPLDKARAAMRFALEQMGPKDTFQIVDFASGVSSLAPRPLDNTPDNVARGLQFIERMTSEGGTEMLAGMRAALEGPTSPGRLRIVAFMTDGYIGNDGEVLAYVDQHVGRARLFSFGVGEEVNRYLLDEMSRRGRGAVQYVRLGEAADPVEQVVETFYARMGQPLLTDVHIDWGGLKVEEAGDAPIPDLFVGLPLRVFGRYKRAGKATIRVQGMQGGRKVSLPVEVVLPKVAPEHRAVEVMWAKQKIASLLHPEQWQDTQEVIDAVTELGLHYSLLTRYTSFVAVERDLVANPTPELLEQALAAVHLPAGMRPESLRGAPRRATLTPNAIKPGDPEILVHAPEDARRVHAILPWGQTVECTWEPVHGAWLGRFLVPREAQEGRYRVRVFITHASGDIERISLTYVVDATAPAMDLTLATDTASPGATMKVRATPIESVTRGAESSVVRIRADVRRAIVAIAGTRFSLSPDAKGHGWTGELKIPRHLAPGAYTVELVVTDMAMNVHRAFATVTVR